MSSTLARGAGYSLVASMFGTLLVGFGVMFGVLDFFSLEGAGADAFGSFLRTHEVLFRQTLATLTIGYLLVVAVMLLVTRAASGNGDGGTLARLCNGLIWASLALRPIWWVALIILTPTMIAATTPGEDPLIVRSAFAAFSMINGVLNTVSEDVGVNIFGGLWFIAVGVLMRRQGTFGSVLPWLGMIVGLLFLLSSGELFGLEAAEGGGLIPMTVSIGGPIWLAVSGVIAVRRVL